MPRSPLDAPGPPVAITPYPMNDNAGLLGLVESACGAGYLAVESASRPRSPKDCVTGYA